MALRTALASPAAIARKLSAGQIKLLRFLAYEGEQPRRIVPSTYDALNDFGLIVRLDGPRHTYHVTVSGRAVLDELDTTVDQ